MELPRVVYALRHNPTGKVYVGSAKSLEKRMKSHIYSLRKGTHPNRAMQDDFYKYGDDYSMFVLDEIHSFDEARREYIWMDVLKSRDEQFGYNTQEHARPFDLSRFEEIKVPSTFTKDYRENKSSGVFPKRLSELRIFLGMSQRQFGKAVGITAQQVNRLEKGKSFPSEKTLKKLSDYFGCAIDDLVAEE